MQILEERNKMKEILGGDGIEKAFEALDIKANYTYKRIMPPDNHWYHGEAHEVWELDDEDFETLCDIKEEDWKEKWGWWRSAEGTNLEGEPTRKMIIKGKEITAWYCEQKLSDYIEAFLEDDYIEEFDSEEDAKDQLILEYFTDEHKYSDFLEYCCEEWGASTERNVCAIAVGLAKLNGMTMGELLTKTL